MDDLRVEIRFKNQHLYREIETAGGCKQFAETCGVSYGTLLDLLSCRVPPRRIVRCEGSHLVVWRKIALRVAETVGMTPEELFPERLYPAPQEPKRATHVAFTVDSTKALPLSSAHGLIAEGPEPGAIAGETKEAIMRVIQDSLKSREREVLERRFGLNDREPQTLSEVGEVLGVSSDRIRQIESNALRRLRHPKQSGRIGPNIYQRQGVIAPRHNVDEES